jgi:hypothetical protein
MHTHMHIYTPTNRTSHTCSHIYAHIRTHAHHMYVRCKPHTLCKCTYAHTYIHMHTRMLTTHAQIYLHMHTHVYPVNIYWADRTGLIWSAALEKKVTWSSTKPAFMYTTQTRTILLPNISSCLDQYFLCFYFTDYVIASHVIPNSTPEHKIVSWTHQQTWWQWPQKFKMLIFNPC